LNGRDLIVPGTAAGDPDAAKIADIAVHHHLFSLKSNIAIERRNRAAENTY